MKFFLVVTTSNIEEQAEGGLLSRLVKPESRENEWGRKNICKIGGFEDLRRGEELDGRTEGEQRVD